ncbi:rhodanese-like domain-containing protein [Nocardioides bruguierae]|uniref:Rhodanese-like domain-containing protein n=1 Tax=Nocardioides bruguierae TaxID=2945102 RepID=A0A9X2D8E0_9ACTN|nr:rhodanese-like domain-containing protein [Nocardioides bruguierae]MCL8026795.1 rhodanese-like domain-containing protein [Nocardioides bruguierae]MCM0621061.1 rhodanese-like domain-containing protein [Nocardioides bruguierae]
MIPTVSIDGVPDPLPEDLTILDVREYSEWEAGHAPGALHIPMGVLPVRLQDVPQDRLLVVCKVGGRSAQAAMYLVQQGYDVINLAGGMEDWAAAGRPLVSENGDTPAVV